MPANGKGESAKPSAKEDVARVFLSYARNDDQPFVKRLYADLTHAGFDVWFDRVSMPSRALTFHQEVRDAIAARERLILVVGPKAVKSDYVIQEWQCAYYAANKCVNPIVRLDGRDAHGNNVDGYSLIPEDLKLLHAEDFRRDEEYDTHLKNLIRQLSESLPPVGKLVAVPELPVGYRAQPERLRALRDLLLLDLQKPIVVTGAAARVGLQGMGGIGKSVLASALAHHPEVQRAFQDGIYWVTIGQQPQVESLQRQLIATMGGNAQFNTRHEGKEQLQMLLADRVALLILDDVWERDHAEVFNVAGARSRILLTTRDAGLVTALAVRENHYRVKLPTMAEAQAILAGAADVPWEQLPSEADQIIKECDRLPLALALCGGMVNGGSSWQNVLAALREHDLEFLSTEHPAEVQHQNASKAMDISVRVLPLEEQQRFAELAVFGADTGTTDAAVATLWEHTAGLSARQTEVLLGKFIRRSLARRPVATVGKIEARLDLHDLLHHFAISLAIRLFGSIKLLNENLIEAYRKKCPGGWHSGPNDGYFFQNLIQHLTEAVMWIEAEKAATDFSWLMRKCELGLLDSITNNYALLNQNAEIRKRLEIWSDFFREKAHILRRGNDEWPTHKILLQLAVEHANDSPLTITAEKWLKQNRCNWSWVRRVPRIPRAEKNPCLAVLEGHSGQIRGALVLSSSRILSWSGPVPFDDDTLRLWDALSGKCLVVLEGHSGPVNGALALAHGQILSWSDDHTLRLWNAHNGQSIAVLKGHFRGVKGALILPDGKILSWSDDKTLRLWDAQSGKCLIVLEGHSGGIGGALILPDGRILSWSGDALSADNTLRLWSALSCKCLIVLKGHSRGVKGALIFPDGKILSWSDDKTLRLWDARSSKCLTVLEGHSGGIGGALILPDGRILSWSGNALSTDNTLRLWDTRSGKCLTVLEGHSDGIGGALVLPDGRILSWSRDVLLTDNTLRLWDARSGKCLTVLEGHSELVKGALTLTDGRILSWDWGTTLRIWDARSGKCLILLEGHSGHVDGALILGDGRILSWSSDETLRIWDARKVKRRTVLEGHSGHVDGVLILPNDGILSWSWDATLRLWDVQSGKCLTVFKGHSGWVNGAMTLRAGRILSWSDDQTLRIWDAQSGKCCAILEGHAHKVEGALILPADRILSWSLDETLRLWDARNGKCLTILEGHSNKINGALALADSRILSWSGEVSGRGDRKYLRLWDGQSGKCLTVLEGHSELVKGALILPDSKILSWSDDKTLRIWDAQSGKCLIVLEGHSEDVNGALILPDGNILSWSDDECMRLWDAKNGKCLEIVIENQVNQMHPEWFHALLKLWNSQSVCGDFFAAPLRSNYLSHKIFPKTVFADCPSRSALLRHKRTSNTLTAWNADSDLAALCLLADGTGVFKQNGGQVCILKLHHGNRRISLAEAEEILTPQLKKLA